MKKIYCNYNTDGHNFIVRNSNIAITEDDISFGKDEKITNLVVEIRIKLNFYDEKPIKIEYFLKTCTKDTIFKVEGGVFS